MITQKNKLKIELPHIVITLLVIATVATVVWAQSALKITVIGDSTVCNYAASKAPQTGWGQVLESFFVANSVTVNNKAIGGRSSRNFYQEGRWAEIVPTLQMGEYVFIQFGHNDRDYTKEERYTDTTDYKDYLRKYVKESRAKGAIAVLISPMNMNAWNGSAVREVFCEGSNNYRGAMQNVAKELSVPFIDLEKKSVVLQKRLGQTYSAQYIHLGLEAGEYPNFPSGIADGTHFQEMGANFMAKFVSEGIRELKSNADLAKLASLLKPLFTVGVSANKSNTGMITESGNSFPEGVSITVKVTPKSGEKCLGWFDTNGKNVTTAQRYTFTMPAHDTTFTVRFEGGTKTVTLITKVASGEGTITPAEGSFNEESKVVITAVPASGWLFKQWEGAATGSENPLRLTMNANKVVSASFTKDTSHYYAVNATTAGGGFVKQSPSGTSLTEGTRVTFTAVPLVGWKFTGWKGVATGTDTLYAISRLNSDVSLTAEFIPVDPAVYEAESGVLGNAIIETLNTGFSGAGYVNLDNKAGSSLEIPVYALTGGTKEVSIFYANGSLASRSVTILQNDRTVIESLTFNTTNDWTAWTEKTLSLTLLQGINTVKVISTSSDGGPNIDKIRIDQSVNVALCPIRPIADAPITRLSNIISFNNVEGSFRVDLFSIDGRRLVEQVITAHNGVAPFPLPATTLKQGEYILRTVVKGETATFKIPITRQ